MTDHCRGEIAELVAVLERRLQALRDCFDEERETLVRELENVLREIHSAFGHLSQSLNKSG